MDIAIKVEELMVMWIAMCTTLGVLLFMRAKLSGKK